MIFINLNKAYIKYLIKKIILDYKILDYKN